MSLAKGLVGVLERSMFVKGLEGAVRVVEVVVVGETRLAGSELVLPTAQDVATSCR